MTAPPDRPAAADQAIDSLVRASFTVIALASRLAAEHDLSLTQLRVIGILRDRAPRMAELAAFLGLERSSASGLIERAVRRGLVQRQASSDDGRAVHISLTRDGERLAAELTEESNAVLAPMIGRLAPDEQQHLDTLLRRALGPVS